MRIVGTGVLFLGGHEATAYAAVESRFAREGGSMNLQLTKRHRVLLVLSTLVFLGVADGAHGGLLAQLAS